MSEKIQISINDFDLFCEAIKSTAKIIDSAKISVDENGMSIYGAHGRISRCEITSNSIYSQSPVSFSVLELNTFVKTLATIKEIHNGDYTDFNFFVELPFLKFSSKKFKTKLSTCSEDVISKFISHEISKDMQPVFEFTTTSEFIRRVGSHSYVFSDQNMLRVYLETKEDMESNAVFATIGNKSTDLNNEMTLKFGLVTFGSIGNSNIILDLERISLMNSVQSNDIRVSLMDRGCLISKTTIKGKNDSFFNITILNSVLKN